MIHIIGAGPAGISIAYYFFLAGFKDIRIYEKTNNIGGLARSWEHENFILDTGPHIFHTNDQEIINDWLEIGSDLFNQGEFNSCNILSNYKENLFHYPLSRETLKENLNSKLFSRVNKEIDDLTKSDRSRSAKSFKDFMEGKVGKTLTEMFFNDYPEKVWGIKTSEMLADWAPQRIELRDHNLPFYNKPFVAVSSEGTGKFYERILNKMSKSEKFKILKNKNLIKIKFNGNNIQQLIFNDSQKIDISSRDHIFSTIPANNFAKFFELDLSLNFRGVRSQYLFFKNSKILPKKYNWAYCSQKEISFNRVTEPSSMANKVSPNGFSYLCVETTFPSGEQGILKNSYKEVINWLNKNNNFNSSGYIPELNTQNFEHYVYPIQDSNYRTGLSKYNSLVSRFKNLSVIGTGGEFHYSDMQIIFRKSKTLVQSYINKLDKENSSYIPLINNLENQKEPLINHTFNKKTFLHQISNVNIPLIAEIGINHNGDIELAKKMMDASKISGANFAKFQLYKKNTRIEKNKLTEFLHETADGIEMSLNDIFDRSKLVEKDCIELVNYGEKIGLYVFFTVFDLESAEFLNSINQKLIKVASMDANNIALHKKINSLNFQTIIISTGMTNFEELKRTLSVYKKNQEILLMSCRSSYPARLEDIDLGEIIFLKSNTKCEIGFSDHTEGNIASLLAVAGGASFIERHFTIDKSLPGPDNKISIDIDETKELSKSLQQVSCSLNVKRKIIHPSEQNTFSMQKKSLRFAHDIPKGKIIHTDDLISMAPPLGYSLFQSNLPRSFLKVKENVKYGDPVSEKNIEIIED